MERLKKSGSSGLTSNAVRTWGMLFLVAGIAGRSIIQNRLLGLGQMSSQELLDALSASQTAMILATAALVLQAIETCAVPIFSFLLVEGFLHTRDWKKYLLRLAGIALLSELPYNLAMSGSFWDTGSRNPVFALVVGLALMFFFRYYEAKALKNTLIKLFVLIAGVLWTVMLSVDHGVTLVLLIAILWALRSRPQLRNLTGAVASVAFSILSPFYVASPMGFLPVHLHNGEPGGENRLFNYLSYPVILLAIGLIAKYLI